LASHTRAAGRQITGEARATLAAGVVKRYTTDGLSVQKIATATGETYDLVRALLLESGVTLRGHGGGWKASQERVAFAADVVRRYVLGGASIQAIAKATGRSSRLVRGILREADVQVPDRPKSGPRSTGPTVVGLVVVAGGARGTVARWGPRETVLLRQSLRMSLPEFSARLGISDRVISKWAAGAVPRSNSQRILDTALRLATPEERTRFFHLAYTPGAAEAGRGWVIHIPVADPDRWRVAQVASELVARFAETYPAVGAAIVTRAAEEGEAGNSR
jgi:transcriptional regulator with XRE-family HTH domain